MSVALLACLPRLGKQMDDGRIPPRLKPFTWWDRQRKKAYAIIPPRRQSLTCSYPFGVIFFTRFPFPLRDLPPFVRDLQPCLYFFKKCCSGSHFTRLLLRGQCWLAISIPWKGDSCYQHTMTGWFLLSAYRGRVIHAISIPWQGDSCYQHTVTGWFMLSTYCDRVIHAISIPWQGDSCYQHTVTGWFMLSTYCDRVIHAISILWQGDSCYLHTMTAGAHFGVGHRSPDR